MPRILRALVAAALLAPSVATGQSASAAAKAFLQAQTDKQWLTMADLVDTSSLRALRASADRSARTYATAMRPETRSAMDSMGMGGIGKTMEGVQSMFGPGSMLRIEYARVQDAAEIQAMSDRELMARWFEAKSFAYMMNIMMGGMLKPMLDKMPAGANSEMQAEFAKLDSAKTRWEIVGEVNESANVAHVVYRVAGTTPSSPAATLTFQRTGGRWLLHFDSPEGQLTQMAQLGMAAMKPKMP